MSNTVKVLFLVPAPENISPGQRFRFEHYVKIADPNKYSFDIKPFFTQKTWGIIYLKNRYMEKLLGILLGFLGRIFTMFTLFKYDYVYIYRDAAVLGPPIFEWIVAKLYRKKIIYDFDDAIWISTSSAANPGAAFLKSTWKVANICKMSKVVTVGNDFLAAYARKYCSDVRVIPTVVNTATSHNTLKDQDELPLTIGWTGTFTNFVYLEAIIPAINKLKERYDFRFLVIADKDPLFKNIDYTFKQWNIHSEIEDLLQLSIGLMPLADTEMEKGKCGFKAIQYMSLGIPPVLSPVGANSIIVNNGITGFWADDQGDWIEKLALLIRDEALRKEMGARARQKIIAEYSVEATKNKFFELFKA
ncbi:MAG: glycosyltransferase [Rhizobacter sp.]|nr:glycosyltransferase [Ferruginibacter sp.]